MPAIFVDANILLGFWSLQDGRVPSELLLPLVELGGNVLITQQVADEVNRNKLGVFLRSSAGFSASLPSEIPTHMVVSREMASWNDRLKADRAELDKARKTWNDSVRPDLANAISNNSDLTSQHLAPLLRSAVMPSEGQLSAARDRRERGNPPGKRSDPLGDQISWQQFLDAVEGVRRVWIITRDGDFAEVVNKSRLLNPLLRSELAERGVEKVEVHDNLANALRSIKEAGVHVPHELDEAKLGELQKQEAEAHYPQPPYLTWPDRPWRCPQCHTVNEGGVLSAHPSQYGGWSYWAHCRRCGYKWDTGEAYDD
ncbi:hypothetical protein NKH95_26010 [Mesorhizobium sp. M0848]|uniref:hypothetical protein n=1 Tax=Mesorhizobium sp. M0848 TaxID=2957012 RepID=UPI00333B40C7